MFQNDPTMININSIPDGMTANDLVSISKMTGMLPMSMGDTCNTSITELKADTIFENLGDILALGFIKSNQYFQLKSMLNSSDRESQEMARKIITTHLQHV
jgi:hypothetical protein